jgi:AhpD family alkylhydroperoxidase
MTVKTAMSRFHVHDELTAPERSLPILKTVLRSGGAISKFLGVLAGAPAALRAYALMRSELRGGALSAGTRARIALAVAEYRGDAYGAAEHAKAARAAGLGMDEIALARSFKSGDEREVALLRYLEGTLLADEGRPPAYLLEEAREADWSDEEILEALAHLALGEFQSLIANAADLPLDQAPSSTELRAA